jgi:acetoacetyl-CoA reductase
VPFSKTNQLQKRIVLVTGATGGLGTAMCKKLFEDGYCVVGSYKTETKAKAWKKLMKEEGYDIDLFKANVSNFSEVEKMVNQIFDKYGVIDVLVNNAAITKDGVFWKMEPNDWEQVISTNLISVFNCSRLVINGMIDRGFGRIINISSVNAQRGQFGQTIYAASKAGMHGFTKSLAMEVASKGVTVNTISPGYIATDIVLAIPDEIIETRIIPSIPVGRLGGTDEVAYLVSFLASDKASFITGANYAINGGQHVF